MFDYNSCIICGYPITNPVCNSCYIKQIGATFHDLEVEPMIKDFVKNKLKDKFHLENLNDAECILCKKDTVTVCHYCFSITLIRTLKELNFPDNLIKNFGYNSIYKEIEITV